MLKNINATIAAISTAMSNSGIGIVRMSGPDAIEIADRVYVSKSQKKLADKKTHTIHYGFINDGDETVDEVLVMLMRAPHTYTGEDTVEINCHGGVYVVKKILELLIKNGARPAEPGEFTKRAFLNGKMDLSQAEAVGDLIVSQNEYALKSSVEQLKGNVKEKISNIRNKIIYHTAFIETALDDPEHISVDGYGDTLKDVVKDLVQQINSLLDTCEDGRIIKEGIKTVILGKPNAGKSSLLNVLLKEDRAIVTDIAGTTRDTLEEHINLQGISLNIIDTAGIRETGDIVEKIGVDKAREQAEQADLILCVVDASVPLDNNDKEILKLIKNKKTILLLNKTDLDTVVTRDEIVCLLNEFSLETDDESDYEKNKNSNLHSKESNKQVSFDLKDKKESLINNNLQKQNENKIVSGLEVLDSDSLIQKIDRDDEFYNSDTIKRNNKIEKEINIVEISAKNQDGVEKLEETLKNMFFAGNLAFNNEIYITNVRQKTALQEAKGSLEKVLESIEMGMPEDFYSIDLMDAYESLGSITGETIGEDLVNEIFSKFCMGK